MFLKIKKAELIPAKFGADIKITMIGLYQDDGKFVKWIKLAEAIEILKTANIHFEFLENQN